MHSHLALTDVHFHPTDFGPDIPFEEVLERAATAGVRQLLASGYSPETNVAVLEMATRHTGVAACVGYHPWFIRRDLDLAALEVLSRLPGVVAVGEIGLDGKCEVEKTLQETWFAAQLELACRIDLPVVVHSRQAVDWVLGVLRQFPKIRGVLHSFPGSGEAAKPFLDLGFYVSVSGAATRENARKVVSLLRYLPPDRLMLETDAPAILIEGLAPGQVEPCHLPRVLAAVSKHTNRPLETLAQETEANVRRLFGLALDKAVSLGR